MEGGLDVLARLCRHLNVVEIHLLREFHGLVILDLPVRQVALISHQRYYYHGVAAVQRYFEPVLYFNEGLPVAQIEHEEGADSASEVDICNALELLLAQRIPDVEVGQLGGGGVGDLKDLVVDLHVVAALLVLVEVVVHISIGNGGLAHLGAADHD